MRTSAKSRNSVKVGPKQIRAAKALAGQYKITVWKEDDGWYGRCVELPNCMGDGADAEAAINSTRAAIVAGLSADLAAGIPAPIPAREGVRSEQVNVRLSPDERTLIEANATRAGFKGLADYIRAVAIGFPRGASAST